MPAPDDEPGAAGSTRPVPALLAPGLLLEAVDTIAQARDLISDAEASAVLSRCSEELALLAERLLTGP